MDPKPGAWVLHPKYGALTIVEKVPVPEGKKFSQVWNCQTAGGSIVQVGTSVLNKLAVAPEAPKLAQRTHSVSAETIGDQVKQLLLCVAESERRHAALNVSAACDDFIA